MRMIAAIVGALGVAVGIASGGCGSTSKEPGGSPSAGAAGSEAPRAGSGGSSADGGTASSGQASGGSAPASGGSAANGGATGDSMYVDLLRANAPDACLPRGLPFGATGGPNEGRVDCTIGELHFDACDCQQPGRAPLSGELLAVFANHAEQLEMCGGASGVDCDAACGCELVQPAGTSIDTSSDLYACQNDVTPSGDVAGFCVIDQERMEAGEPAPIGNPELVAHCPSASQRRIRFVGQGLPPTDAAVFIACPGAL